MLGVFVLLRCKEEEEEEEEKEEEDMEEAEDGLIQLLPMISLRFFSLLRVLASGNQILFCELLYLTVLCPASACRLRSTGFRILCISGYMFFCQPTRSLNFYGFYVKVNSASGTILVRAPRFRQSLAVTVRVRSTRIRALGCGFSALLGPSVDTRSRVSLWT